MEIPKCQVCAEVFQEVHAGVVWHAGMPPAMSPHCMSGTEALVKLPNVTWEMLPGRPQIPYLFGF